MTAPPPPPHLGALDRRSWHTCADIEAPNAARIYDYLLGGSHNFAADRKVARAAIDAVPDLPTQALANRAFLHRAIRYLTSVGVRRFIDIGSGVPTLGNVHEIAQHKAADARVVYVDNDPVAVAHSRHLLAGNDRATAIQEDLRDPQRILSHPDVSALLDPTQPVAVLLVAVLHFIPDTDQPIHILEHLRAAISPGSYLVIAHGVNDTRPADADAVTTLWARTPTPLTLRGRPQIEALFAGLTLVTPGLVWAPLWRPEHPDPPQHPHLSANLVGVGRTT